MTVLRLPWVKRSERRTAFVLGGGGNLGAIQVGMLRAVMEHGFVPDFVVGCSAGAINGAGVALDPTVAGVDRLESLWLEITTDIICPAGKLSTLRLLAHRGSSLQENDGLRRVLESNLPADAFEALLLPLHVVAASLRDGREHWFSKGPLIAPLLASAALPAIFPPVKIDDEPFIDGGVVNNVPISKALELGASRVIVFHVGNFERSRPEPKRPIDVLVQSFSIARSSRFVQEIGAEHEGVEMIVLPGVDPGRLRYDDFSHSRELIERGHAGTAAFLDLAREKVAAGE